MKPAPLPEGWEIVQRGGLVYRRCPHGVESVDFTRTPAVFVPRRPLESEKWENCAKCKETSDAE